MLRFLIFRSTPVFCHRHSDNGGEAWRLCAQLLRYRVFAEDVRPDRATNYKARVNIARALCSDKPASGPKPLDFLHRALRHPNRSGAGTVLQAETGMNMQ